MRAIGLSAFVLGSLLAAGGAATAPPPVKVDGGLVQGVADGNLTVYKGIQFAAPPAGPLRWRAPQRVAPSSGVRSADRFAPACMQAGTASEASFILTYNFSASNSGTQVPTPPTCRQPAARTLRGFSS
jgi:Carboxylesterase family